MIVIDSGTKLIVVQQNDHAHLSGEMLSLWVDHELVAHPLRDEIIFAARHHDNGWREEDAVPRLDPDSGRPHTFMTLSAAPRIEIWRRAVARYAQPHPFATALIYQHALALHRRVADHEPYRGLVTELGQSMEAHLERHLIDAGQVTACYPWIDLTDIASLAACDQFPRPAQAAGHRVTMRDGVLHVDPFPLAGTTRFRLACREIDRREYASDQELRSALARAPWTEREIRMAPP